MLRDFFVLGVFSLFIVHTLNAQWTGSGNYFLPASNDLLLHVGNRSIHLFDDDESIDEQKWEKSIEWVHLQGDILYLISGSEMFSFLVSNRGLDLLDQFTAQKPSILGMQSVVFPSGTDTIAWEYNLEGAFSLHLLGSNFEKRKDFTASYPKSELTPLKNTYKHQFVVGDNRSMYYLNIPGTKAFVCYNGKTNMISFEVFLPYVGLDHLQDFFWMKDPITQRIFGIAKGRANQYHIFDLSQGSPKPEPLSTDGGMIRYPEYTWMDFPHCYLGKVNFPPLYIRKSEIVGEKERIMLFQLKK